MTPAAAEVPPSADERLDQMLHVLGRMASGQSWLRIPVSGDRDRLDALAHGINALAGELLFRTVSQATLQDVLDAIGAVVLLVGPHGEVQRVNEFALAISGRATDQLIGRHVSHLFATTPEVAAAVGALMAGSPLADKELDFLTVQDPVRLTWMMTRVPPTDEHESFFVLVGRDQRADRRAVELEKANLRAIEASRAKDRFIANVSHEIRTPLTAIMATADLLARSEPTAEALAKRADRIRRNTRQLVRIIDDILDYSLIESGRFSLAPSQTSPADVLRSIEESYADLARSKGVALSVSLAAAVPATVHTDPERVRQVVDNLVSNALKFTASGEVRVQLDWEGGAANGALRFHVVDTGIGIDPEVAAHRLFRSFEQADERISAKYRGTGLGLALSRKLARQMGGDVELVRTLPGLGSTFSAWFPVPVASRRA